MPHFMCVACRTRLYRRGTPPQLVGELCPECGGLLEPVSDLADVVGFRRITRRVDLPEFPDLPDVAIAQAAALPRRDETR
jgi:hypothetical protein